MSKQIKYVKEMKEEGVLHGNHADKLFEMIERDLDRLDMHKLEVFEEHLKDRIDNRMSMQSNNSHYLDRETIGSSKSKESYHSSGASSKVPQEW